ncbi:MAG: AbrB/MazE/SpoVT family DNA-binding domain-containing protein [Hyphomicrobiales bacterium]
MYKLKIIAVDGSAGVVLPASLLEKLGVCEGDVLCLTDAPDVFKITPFSQEFSETMEIAEQVMQEEHDTLRKLAKWRRE